MTETARTRSWHRRRRACVRAAAIAAACLAPLSARAQVLEIGADGAVTRHDGPALYLTPDLRPVPIRAAVAVPEAGRAQSPPAAGAIADTIAASARSHGISAALISAIAWHESRFRPRAVSSAGAIGVMQLMPATARFLRVDPFDATANIEGGVTLLAALLARYRGDLVKALAAYDAGPAAVDRYGGVPPYRETRAYVASILDQLSLLANDGGAGAGFAR